MYEVICPQCKELVSGVNEEEAMREYSFHWLIEHEEHQHVEGAS